MFWIQHLTVLGAKYVSNQDCWRHFGKRKPQDVIIRVYWLVQVVGRDIHQVAHGVVGDV